MYTITKEFHFSASHELKNLPEDHQCYRLHGHNYIIKVELQSEELNEYDFVQDYGELKKIKIHIDEKFDHRHRSFFIHSVIVFSLEDLSLLFVEF